MVLDDDDLELRLWRLCTSMRERSSVAAMLRD
jgi:hypothetical protein